MATGKLTELKIRSVKEAGRYFDGQGLYLEVTAAGGRYWRCKYRFAGKEKRLAFGVYPEVSLKLARERLAAARELLASGVDPGQEKVQAKARADRQAAMTFEVVAREWLEHRDAKWTPGTRASVLASLETHVFPKIGAWPMASIRSSDVLQLVTAIDATGAGETAGRVLQRVGAVFRYAVNHERIEANPMLNLKPADVLKPRIVRHRAAMTAAEVPAFMRALAAYRGDPTTLAAMRLLMLTAVRPGEVRGADWSEIDLENAVWIIPAARMKMRLEHVVPLSRQALRLVSGLKTEGASGLVFPSPYYPGKSLSENTLNSALARMGYKGEHTAHGFRALFSTAANEHGHDADVIERQLAHVERDDVRAAYNRASYLVQRRALMQWWADWLDAAETVPR